MPIGHPIAYRDELGPAYGFGKGAASPGNTALAGGLAAIRGLTFTPGDYVDVVIQFDHDVEIPPTGNLTFDAHAHWSFVAAPAAGATVIWEFEFIGSKPSTAAVAVFPSTSTTLHSDTFVCTSTELRQHLLSDMGDVVVPSSSYGPSYVLWGTFRLSTAATVAAAKACLLSFDLHKKVGNFGSATEYV